MDNRFKTSFVRASLRVDVSHIIDGTSCFSQFHVSLLLAPISRIKKSTSFLKLSLKSISTAISQTSLLSNLTTLTSFLLIKTLNLTKLGLVPLDGFCGCSQTPLPSLGSCDQFLDGLVQAPIGLSRPCSLLAQEQLQLLQEQLEVLPFQLQDDASVCQVHGLSDHHHQVGQGDP